MRRIFLGIVIVLGAAWPAFAAGEFDGEWSGRILHEGDCYWFPVTLVQGQIKDNKLKVTIEARYGREYVIEGEIDSKNTLTARGVTYKQSWNPAKLNGSFSGSIFKGIFFINKASGSGMGSCRSDVLLLRGKGPYTVAEIKERIETEERTALIQKIAGEGGNAHQLAETTPAPAEGYDGEWAGEWYSPEKYVECGLRSSPFKLRVENNRFVGTVKDSRKERVFEGEIGPGGKVALWGHWYTVIASSGQQEDRTAKLSGVFSATTFRASMASTSVWGTSCFAKVLLRRGKGPYTFAEIEDFAEQEKQAALIRKVIGKSGASVPPGRAQAESKRILEEARKAAETERKRIEEEAAITAEAERKRILEEAQKTAEAERKRILEEAARKVAAADRNRAEEDAARKVAETERKRIEEAAAKAAEAERKRILEEAQKTAEAERKRILEEAKMAAEAESKRILEEARKTAEAEFLATTERMRLAKLNAERIASEADPYRDIDFGKYYALVIGNNDYDFLGDLKTAVADAKAVAEVLQNRYGFEVELLLNATRDGILRSLGMLRRKLTEDDSLLIYYAGHGNIDEDAERGYWQPVDSELDFKARWISNADISDTLKAMDAWHVMVVADSCYSGTLIRSARPVFAGGGDQAALIKRLAVKKSRTVLTSGGLEPVADSGGGDYSVFAKAFLDALRENTGVIEAQRLFSNLRAKVVVNADQTPEYSDVRKAGHDGGDFLFVMK